MTADELDRHLAVLDLHLGADLEAARAARRALLKRWHPDRFPAGSAAWHEATDRSQRINEAFREVERGLALGVSPPLDWDPREWPYRTHTEAGGLPLGFRDLAWRLRAGERPLDLRNEIVAREGIPKVKAARRVENVRRALRAAWGGLGGGALLLAVLGAMVVSEIGGPVLRTLYAVLALVQIVPAALVLRSARPPRG